MAAMGEMLENIAHQWRQPLSVISTASTGMQIQLEFNKKIPEKFLLESIISINEQSQYLSKTIDDFRNFFKPNKKKESFYIKDTIEKSLYLVNSRIKRNNVKIIKDIKHINLINLESELIQIFLNIFNNAIDALELNKIDNKHIIVSAYNNEESLFIEIKDNAGGIPKKILHRVLEPYFTTKHKAQGTGIGLYMSNEIVSKHLNGEMIVSNCSFLIEEEHYRGALFVIKIPLKIEN
jgi:signal transduction histidine kinase